MILVYFIIAGLVFVISFGIGIAEDEANDTTTVFDFFIGYIIASLLWLPVIALGGPAFISYYIYKKYFLKKKK